MFREKYSRTNNFFRACSKKFAQNVIVLREIKMFHEKQNKIFQKKKRKKKQVRGLPGCK